ncbi:alpha-amylase family glycosyl hydrolase [Sporosarcina sp. G11-34]|uniref:alpha-amylase family glycosyl hydrolase n=1 Tax=Sporosarcina sp. G11-34 TaxID=2849605 RepID=UPI0022A9A8C9|nr:alpha-amylase family glycosyl hydrolase [Sporosarcina sp. G11-34]MCZ2257245.1 alpha-amylase [Sporosarcina sp. G11-34]
MKVNRWFGIILSAVLTLSIINPMGVLAENNRSFQDESIYDLLVDRFNNGNYNNDEGTNPQDLSAFSGGDFAGIHDRVDYIMKMGLTMVSLGPIFSTAKYDGSEVLDYEKLEPNFGTDEDLAKMIDKLHENELKVIADFPLSGVSEDHVWAKDGLLPSTPAGDGIINWDSSDADVQKKLKEAVISFVKTYELDGIRLTKLADFDDTYLNEVIAELKEVNDDIYVISTEQSTANFDSVPNIEKMDVLKQAFVQVNPATAPLALFEENTGADIIQFDELSGPRFTYEMFELRMFPPTRWKLAATALFMFPGVPVMPYGTEIAVNGEKAPESHPISNFKTDEELIEYIGDLNKLRNESEALRNGDIEMLHNEDGFTIFKRSNDQETWIVALNNTSGTVNVKLPEEVIGADKKLRGVVDGDLIKQSDDGSYNVILDREVAEVYISEEDTGFNTPYLIASIMVLVLFFGFMIAVKRRGKKNAAE